VKQLPTEDHAVSCWKNFSSCWEAEARLGKGHWELLRQPLEQPFLAMLSQYEEPPQAEGRNCKLHPTADSGNGLSRVCITTLP